MDYKVIPQNEISDILNCLQKSKDLTLISEEMKEGLKKILIDYKKSKEFDFRIISNYIYDGIYIADGNCVTLFVNDAYEKITGIRADEIVGKSVYEILKSGLYENAVCPDVVKYKKTVSSIASSKRSGKTILITGKPILDENGNVKKVVMLNRDITELMDLKSHLEETEMKLEVMQEYTENKYLEIKLLRKQNIKKEEIIAESSQMKEILEQVKSIAPLNITILITGETGVGKEIIANAIYENSTRSQEPYIKVNCGAIPGNLLESELFGYEKGAFSGASETGKIGMFELANKGTILLDEIGDMPFDLQIKLLRVLQNKVLYRVGGTKPINLDVRVIACTNWVLRDRIKKGLFREDLFYRLNVFPIHIPPLRERPKDIMKLVDYFRVKFNKKYEKNISFEICTMERFKNYKWPGNIRELENVIERIVVISDNNHEISNEGLNSILIIDNQEDISLGYDRSLKEIVEEVERKAIEYALKKHGNTRKAGDILKVDQSTIVRKANKLGIKWDNAK